MALKVFQRQKRNLSIHTAHKWIAENEKELDGNMAYV